MTIKFGVVSLLLNTRGARKHLGLAGVSLPSLPPLSLSLSLSLSVSCSVLLYLSLFPSPFLLFLSLCISVYFPLFPLLFPLSLLSYITTTTLVSIPFFTLSVCVHISLFSPISPQPLPLFPLTSQYTSPYVTTAVLVLFSITIYTITSP